jgi:hypothetical protein
MASRWITVRQRFDYRWPSGAITHFSDNDLGEHMVKAELADFAVEKGYATDGKADASARSEKGKRRRTKGKPAAKAADSGPDDAVAQPDMADADRPAGGQPLDPDAE